MYSVWFSNLIYDITWGKNGLSTEVQMAESTRLRHTKNKGLLQNRTSTLTSDKVSSQVTRKEQSGVSRGALQLCRV